MPAIIPVVIAAGSVGAAGGLAAVGAGIMAGSLASIAVGLTVVGAGLSVASKLTGSKTLGKIGMGFSIAGAAGGLASGLSKAATAGVAGKEGLGAAAQAEGSLLGSGSELNTAIADNGFKSFDPSISIDGMIAPDNMIGNVANFDPKVVDGSLFERVNENLNKYNGAMNVVGGVGKAVLGNQRTEAQVKNANRDRDFQREVSDRDFEGSAGALSGRNVEFNQAPRGLLRANSVSLVPQR